MNLDEFSKQLAGYRESSLETRDVRLHDDCIVLLSELAHLLDRLDREAKSARLSGAIDVAKDILVEMLEFDAHHFGNDSVAPVLGRVCELRDMARDIQSLVGRSFWSRLFGGDHQHDELRQQAYRQLGEEFAVGYRELLSVIDGNFEMHETTNEWRASCRVFVDDFRRRW